MPENIKSAGTALLLPYEREGAGSDLSDAAARLLAMDSDGDDLPEPSNPPRDEPDPDDSDDYESDDDESQDDDGDPGDSDDGDDDDVGDEDGTGDEESDQRLYPVKVDGKEEKVTIDEALKGYSRTQNYTRDKQALAEQRRAFEAEAADTREARQTYIEGLANIQKVLERDAPQPPDTALEQSNPRDYELQYARYSRRKGEIEAVHAERVQAEQEQSAEMETLRGKYREQQRGRLIEAVPEWSDVETAKKAATEMATSAMAAYGFTDSEMSKIDDHRVILMMRDAMRYRAASESAQGKRGSKKSKLRPGGVTSDPRRSAKNRSHDKNMARAKQSGHVRDAADVIAGLIRD